MWEIWTIKDQYSVIKEIHKKKPEEVSWCLKFFLWCLWARNYFSFTISAWFDFKPSLCSSKHSATVSVNTEVNSKMKHCNYETTETRWNELKEKLFIHRSGWSQHRLSWLDGVFSWWCPAELLLSPLHYKKHSPFLLELTDLHSAERLYWLLTFNYTGRHGNKYSSSRWLTLSFLFLISTSCFFSRHTWLMLTSSRGQISSISMRYD